MRGWVGNYRVKTTFFLEDVMVLTNEIDNFSFPFLFSSLDINFYSRHLERFAAMTLIYYISRLKLDHGHLDKLNG